MRGEIFRLKWRIAHFETGGALPRLESTYQLLPLLNLRTRQRALQLIHELLSIRKPLRS
jgi:hypothetical protein